MFHPSVITTVFVSAKMVICYGLMVVFLSFPPVVALNQQLAQQLMVQLPEQVGAIIIRSPDATLRVVATQDALRLVWFGGDSGAYTPAERQHLRDVHQWFVRLLFGVGVAVAAVILLDDRVLWQERDRVQRRLAAALAVLTVMVAVFFPPFFALFHQLFFPQGNYAFAADSLLIQTFPPAFWWLVTVQLQLGVVALLLIELRYTRPRVV